MRFLSVLLLIFAMAGCIEGDYALLSLHEPETIYIEVEVPVEVEVEVPVEVEVEVPVEVQVPVPGCGGDVWIDSFEQPYSMNGIDIIWLIDLSGSMNQHAQSVVTGIEAMMNALPPTGWRLGITSMSWYFSSQVQEFPLLPGDTVQDAWDAYNNISNPQEAGFDSLYSYMVDSTYNPTWLREDAGLLVVFVSDEEEQSQVQFNGALTYPNDFINWYASQRNSVFLASIVNVDPAESVCPYAPSSYYTGERYIEATNAFAGTVVDICSADWAPGVQAAANQAQPHEEWELTYTPIEDTLIVFVDFVEFHDWIYDILSNTVGFTTIPPEGSLVEIGYVIEYGGDDDDSAGDDDDSSSS